MRVLTFVVFFLTAVLSFVIGWQFIKRKGLNEYSMRLFRFSLGLVVIDYFLTIIYYKSFSPANIVFCFFIKHFWFIILSLVFLKHILIPEKNFWYYFCIPVFISVLLITFFEVLIIGLPIVNENFIVNFSAWSSYFGVFGGVAAGLLVGCLKTMKDVSQWARRTILIKFFLILFLCVCSVFPAFVMWEFIPPGAFYLGSIAPIFIYVISFIMFGELIDLKYQRKNRKKVD